jgi:ABC-type phosphate transport system substrate-binding protein
MTRLLGIAAAALATAGLVVATSSGSSAQSKKPKEIVVAGSKTPAKASKVESLSIKQKATESRGGKNYKLQNAWPMK